MELGQDCILKYMKCLNTNFLAFILCLILNMPAFSQCAILNKEDTLIVKGRIVDNYNRPIKFQRITFYGNIYLSELTNKNGEYEILLTPEFRSDRNKWYFNINSRGIFCESKTIYLKDATVQNENGKTEYILINNLLIQSRLISDNPHETKFVFAP